MQLQEINIRIKSNNEELRRFLRERPHQADDKLIFQDLNGLDFSIYRANVTLMNYLKATCRHQQSTENRLNIRISISPNMRNILLFFTGLFIYMYANTIYFNWDREIFFIEISILTGIFAFIFVIWYFVTQQFVNRFSRDIELFFKTNDL